MNEKEFIKLMQNVDVDLLEENTDELTEVIDIDMESITKKALDKLQKENIRMKKRKSYPVIAAALIAALSVSAVYASDISDFITSLFNKTEIYSTVVDGEAFFLDKPLKLDESTSLENLMFTKDDLSLNIKTNASPETVDSYDISIMGKDKRYIPGGYGYDRNNNHTLNFFNETDDNYNFYPVRLITLNLNGKSYTVELSEGKSVVDANEIKEPIKPVKDNNNKAPISIDWMKLGFKETEKGVQILTSFDDKELKLSAIGKPESETVTSMFDRAGGISSSTSNSTDPLIGYDKDNNTYTFDWDKDAVGRPVTIFESDAPDDKEIELKIPSITVYYDFKKEFPKHEIQIPELNQELTLNKEIDFNLQKMILKTIKRTSDTTAELTFELNTGDKKEVFLRNTIIDGENIKKFDCVWDESTAKITMTFDKSLKNTQLSIYAPNFVIKGDWSLLLNASN